MRLRKFIITLMFATSLLSITSNADTVGNRQQSEGYNPNVSGGNQFEKNETSRSETDAEVNEKYERDDCNIVLGTTVTAGTDKAGAGFVSVKGDSLTVESTNTTNSEYNVSTSSPVPGGTYPEYVVEGGDKNVETRYETEVVPGNGNTGNGNSSGNMTDVDSGSGGNLSGSGNGQNGETKPANEKDVLQDGDRGSGSGNADGIGKDSQADNKNGGSGEDPEKPTKPAGSSSSGGSGSDDSKSGDAESDDGVSDSNKDTEGQKDKVIIRETVVVTETGQKVHVILKEYPNGEVIVEETFLETEEEIRTDIELGVDWIKYDEEFEYGIWWGKNKTNPDWSKYYGTGYRYVNDTEAASTTYASTHINFRMGRGPVDDGTWSVIMEPYYVHRYYKRVIVEHVDTYLDKDGNEVNDYWHEIEVYYHDLHDQVHEAVYYEVTVPLVCGTCPEINICLGPTGSCDCGNLNTKCDDELEPEFVIDHRSELTN